MPARAVTYRRRPYVNDTRTLGQLLLHRGDRRSAARREQGAISARLWSTLGQQIAGTVGQIQQDRQQRPAIEARTRLYNAQSDRIEAETVRSAPGAEEARSQAFLELLQQDRSPELPELVDRLGREGGMAAYEGMQAIEKAVRGEYADKQDILSKAARGILALDEEMWEPAWNASREALVAARVISPEEAQTPYSPEALMQLSAWDAPAAGKPATRSVRTVNDQGQPVTRIVADEAGAEYPAQETADAGTGPPRSDYDAALRRYEAEVGHPLSTDEEMGFRRRFTDAGGSQATIFSQKEAVATARGIADAIARGEQPPALTGLREYTALVRKALADKGYDLTRATQDWNAIKRHVLTMNSAAQLRMRQATRFAYESLDLVEQYANEWDAGQFPALNSIELAAARQGVLGPEAQRVGTQLHSVITDLQSELATVYRGGLSSTDTSIELAAENLKTEWSKEQLIENVKLMRTTLRIRLNSIEQTGVSGTPGNQYNIAPPIAGGVMMVSPDGAETMLVPADQVERLEGLGATRAR